MSSQIPGYQVIRKVGEGGMSTVYLAIQLSVGREVALKILSPELRNDAVFAERFYREANILGSLSHHNIIAIYDVGKHGEHYFMAMDYLPGASCKELVRSKQLKPIQALRIVRDINAATEYVHKQGFLHCDIKPDNILFRKDGSAVLTDFGIAREIKSARKSKTIAGTPHYMSPEQAQGQKLDTRSDIYSLGILLYEMLTYDVPYHGADAVSVAIKHVSAPLPLLPKSLETFAPLINKLMAKRPGARLQNATEIAHAIDFTESRYLKHASVDVPFKVKASLYAQHVMDKFNFIVNIKDRLSYSTKHGLILRLVDDQYDIPDIDGIAKAMESDDDKEHNQTQTTQRLQTDAIALALETQQAKRLLSPLQSLLCGILLLGAIFSSTLIDISQDIIARMSTPTVIYID